MRAAFDIVHPAFAAIFLCAVLVHTMAAFHPVFLVLSLCAGLAYNVRLQGWRDAFRPFVWQLPLAIIIALVNPIVSSAGSTVLFCVGNHAFYFEALAYGMCMGVMLVAMFQWFSVAARLLTSDKVMVLLGKFAPTLGLLVTMTMRLVPQFARRGEIIAQAQSACTAAGQTGTSLADRARQVTVLMSWGMEDSLETSDSMRARGWGSSSERTSYERHPLRAFDIAAIALLCILVALCTACAWFACASFAFYPSLGPWIGAWAYLPFVALLLSPLALEVVSR